MRTSVFSKAVILALSFYSCTSETVCANQAPGEPPSAVWGDKICERWAEIPVQENTYLVRNNAFADNAGKQCIQIRKQGDRLLPGFRVVCTEHTYDPKQPASYPGTVKGCHPWGSPCTSGWTHKKVRDIRSLSSKWLIGGTLAKGIWNAAFDIWINPTTDTSGPPTGTELMVWLRSKGDVAPAGTKVGTAMLREMISGRWQAVEYGVYHKLNHGSSRHYVAYRRKTPTNRVDSINLKDALDDCVKRTWCNPQGYLVAVEAGFEIWQGGEGLTSLDFAVR